MEPDSIMTVAGAMADGAVSGLFAGLAFFMVVRTELKYLRRDVDMAHSRLSEHMKEEH